MPDTPLLKNEMDALLHRESLKKSMTHPSDDECPYLPRNETGGLFRQKGGRGIPDTPPPHGRGGMTGFRQNGGRGYTTDPLQGL